MAAKARTIHHSPFSLLVLLLSVLIVTLGGADGGLDGSRSSRCPRIPSMTAQQACSAVSGTRHMLELCLRRLRAGGVRVPLPVTRHAAVAVRGALDAYAATVAAATSLLDGGAVPADDERTAFGNCMVGYGSARVAMARVADDLRPAAGGGGCDDDDDRAAELKVGYTAGLRGMDGCTRGMLDFPASTLYARNLADRNVTLLAALLCSLVPAPLA
ncbi:uncharacterized protein [Miscanthus floridulus]|uniref:uncharacterized protein n=1 Tax=Miscanthus floridulus TaxID=154761 RepID=UPI00345A602A